MKIPSRFYRFDFFPVILICFATLGPPNTFQFSFVPILYSIGFVILHLLKNKKLDLQQIIILFLIGINFLTFTIFISANHLKETTALLMILSSLIYLKSAKTERLNISVNLSLYILLIFSLIQIFTPRVWEIISLFLTRSSDIYSQGSRGISALAPEPSFMAIQLLAILTIKIFKNNLRNLDLYLISFLCLLTYSVFGVAVLLITILSSFHLKNRNFIIISCLLGLIVIYNIGNIQNIRSLNILANLYDFNFDFILSDTSISSRIFYILKDFYHAVDNYFIPLGPGNYYLFEKNTNPVIQNLLFDKYDANLAGSYFGYWLIEYGFLIIIYTMFVLKNTFIFLRLYTLSFFNSSLITALYILILLQMISIVYSPFAFLIAILLHKRPRTKID